MLEDSLFVINPAFSEYSKHQAEVALALALSQQEEDPLAARSAFMLLTQSGLLIPKPQSTEIEE